ncbi:MAG: dihydrodipicolinate synthase family protein [Clostridiaceae bacterium]|nr:dihydrodipicolinate synthase family protein [Clostridiaceae bacterium]
MKKGMVPALGTPLDEQGNLLAESYEKQIERMIEAGSVALLSMGSMGQQAFIRNEVCVRVAETAVKATRGRVPIFVGAMDNSIVRAKQRVASMEHLDIEAFVFTTPYYDIDTQAQVLHYFREVAASTKHGMVLYDLPSVTKFKITYDMVCSLRRDVPNLMGIKSADLNMLRKISLNPEMRGMKIYYSGLDSFDIAYLWGIGSVLDGMPTCTPVNTEKMMRALDSGDRAEAARYLDNIIALRDFFLANDLWPCYSAAMNMLGFAGKHAPDWAAPLSEATEAAVLAEMQRIGEL